MASKSSKCCSWPVIVIIFVLLAVGGVLAWLFLPSEKVADILPDFGDLNNNTLLGTKVPATAAPTLAPTPAPTPTASLCEEETCCNGIDGLCDMKANEIMYLTVHNAMATQDEGFLFGPNHLERMEDALEAGYRGIGLDVCNCDGEYVLCHGKCGLGERSMMVVFENIQSFLAENGNEILVLTLEISNGAGQAVELEPIFDALNDAGLADQLHQRPVGSTDEWPTLAELKAAGTRILLFHHDGADCSEDPDACPAGMLDQYDYMFENTFDFDSVEALENFGSSCQIQRGTFGTGDFLSLNAFVTPNSFPNQKAAAEINTVDFLSDLVDGCSSELEEASVNLVSVDFWHIGNAVEFQQSYNEDLLERRRRARNRKLLRKKDAAMR